MNYEEKISQLLIVGGTHGNEMSGIQAVKNWQSNVCQTPLDTIYNGKIHYALANQEAIDKCVRFTDEDLNRQFTPDKLKEFTKTDYNLNNEQKIAHELNKQYGPKDKPSTDFVIDIHNTTSNMGPTLIILDNTEFYKQLARYVKSEMPESIILFENNQSYSEFCYLCTIGKKGVMIEVGAQPQGVLKAEVYNQTVTMTEKVVEFVQLYNDKQVNAFPEVEAFWLGKEVEYPSTLEDGKTEKLAVSHENLHNNDFKPLHNGQPCFQLFTGEVITWQEETTYPHFIGEAAYYKANIAFATASKIKF